MMRDERLCRCASGNGMHHRSLHLQEPSFDQEGSDSGDDPASSSEDLVDLRIGDQINVALPIPGLDVGQPMPFFGQRAKGLTEKGQVMNLDREFVRLGTKQRSGDPDPVAKIQLFDNGIGLV